MKFELHPDAIKRFDEISEMLLKGLNIGPICPAKRTVDLFEPEFFISLDLTENIIGYGATSVTDWTGNEIALFFDYGGNRIGLCGDNYNLLLRLAEDMQKSKQLYQYVSVSFLKNTIFKWIEEKYTNKISSSAMEYVILTCEKNVVESEIWIPVAETCIQSEIDIGKITLKTITKDKLTDCIKCIDECPKSPDEKERIKREFMGEYQEKVQGLAAVTIRLLAEPERANEIAKEEAEKALSILRIFSPSIFHPKLISYCTTLGSEHINTNISFQLKIDKSLTVDEGVENKSRITWIIDDKLKSMIKASGLDILSNILVNEKKTIFQDQVLDALFLYSKSSLANNFVEKMIYILVAIESILLKDENEPIQKNIGERMAFLIENEPKKRKDVITNITKIYKIRSAFIHHGKTIDDVESLGIFLRNSYVFFTILIQYIDKFESNLKLIEKIEDIRLGFPFLDIDTPGR
jgi:hypothetical protein